MFPWRLCSAFYYPFIYSGGHQAEATTRPGVSSPIVENLPPLAQVHKAKEELHTVLLTAIR